MPRKILAFAALALMCPLLLGQAAVVPMAEALTIYLLEQATCPEQTFRDPAAAPFTVDMTKIAIDPNTNRQCLLGWTMAVVGGGWTWGGPTIKICDPESDQMTLTASTGTLKLNTDGTYVVTGLAGNVSTVLYCTMTLVDKPPAPLTPITRKGTFGVMVLAKNKPPSLCGGMP